MRELVYHVLYGGGDRTVATVTESVHTYPNGVLLIDQRVLGAGSQALESSCR